VKQEQQRVAVGPGNGRFISVRQVSSDAAAMQRGTCVHAAVAYARDDAFTPPPAPAAVAAVRVSWQIGNLYSIITTNN